MTKKIKKVYAKLTLKNKIGVILGIILLVMVSLMFGAFAGSGITFSNQAPTGTIGNPMPAISVDVSSMVYPEDVYMFLNGSEVNNLSIIESNGTYKITHTPLTKLADDNYEVSVSVYDSDMGITETTNWNFVIDAAPNASNWQPAKESTVFASNPKVSVYVKDTFNNLDKNTLSAKIDGKPVTATIDFKGHWETWPCGTFWIIDSYQEGTISFNTSKLANGIHTVEITIADVAGNVLTESWSFYVSNNIQFSSHAPKNQIGNAKPTISVTAQNGDAVMDKTKVNMLINNVPVTPTVADYLNGITISYTPVEKLPDGTYNVYVEVFDTVKAVYDSTSWSFKLDAAPNPINWSPGKDSTATVSNPTIKLEVQDAYNNLNASSVTATLDGSPVPASFTYYTEVAACGAVWTYNNRGTVSINTSGLQNGVHAVQISIADDAGNTLTETWSFTVGAPPEYTNLYPANKSKNTAVGRVSAALINGGVIQWDTVKVSINGSYVNSADLVLDEAARTVTYHHNFADGDHLIYMEATDDKGNTGKISWTFSVDTTPPGLRLTNKTKNVDFLNGTVISDGWLRISGRLTDAGSNIKENAYVKLNGEILLSFNNGMWHYVDPCSSNGNPIYKNLVDFEYSRIIPNGEYVLEIYGEDVLGNSITYTRSFTVKTYPVISNIAPVKYGVDQLTPTISASVTSSNHVIDTIDFTVNGIAVNYHYDPVSGVLSYTPSEPLANESYHSASLTVVDDSGLSASRSWQFLITTYPDMYDANVSNCTSCHDSLGHTYLIGRHNTIWQNEATTGFHDYNFESAQNCRTCHEEIDLYAWCSDCHGRGTYGTGSTESLRGYSPYFPLRIKTSREYFDCIVCHQPGTSVVNNFTNQAISNHDIPGLHKTAVSDCNSCHASSLTREHARPGRTDANNQPINCNTCHKSTDTQVQSAITNKDKDCSACHGQADHESLHTNTMDANCATCHSGTLTTEHMRNQLTTGGKGYDCDTCHNSTRTDVKRTIAQDRLNCTGCHTSGHDVYFADDVPLEVPFYAGFNWTTPIDAAMFAGESNVPSGYELGQVVMSNRRATFTGKQIWDFYYSNLVTNNGWTLKSGTEPIAEEPFRAEFTKGIRSIHLFVFKTGTRDGTGNNLAAGYRIEVWYK